ncbi:DUF456 domain-containing protein [Sinimarinibacterium sp. CAU 1509]|uniref:DUF456 domain-containing protein n=1 Tax=Sinimarinibacterium sp. CAU 1509 TaxID=2562283 RepID=UPI0010AC3D72|nr:DUF456 family protein [Sinimarinibacterium sp. CAU 1509]TJY64698.1 DUF456 domain-containing protein [Sinimarinibacterium sp. CAU 1509]
MDPVILVLLWLAVVALVAVGLAGAVLPALPGVPMVFIGLWLAAWIDHYERVGMVTLIVLGVLVAIAIAVDFIASALGAKRVGASPKAIWGSILGSIVGMFFGLIGIVLGPFIGAVLGELAARSSMQQAANVGIATWMGLLFGTLAKLALSLTMLGVFAFAYLF